MKLLGEYGGGIHDTMIVAEPRFNNRLDGS